MDRLRFKETCSRQCQIRHFAGSLHAGDARPRSGQSTFVKTIGRCTEDYLQSVNYVFLINRHFVAI
ncbi:hypothetical protein NGR_b11980 (plasmid) [Sinorhizobium fredii NGR234]|uniref:Uncharacterized protein n=1 Tax=Sinorhizobium fredii (strain NBRC 101917 / NGR234) TaxID=394 RepID=C3KRE3_SINFN|nr:hypothetical protein NGR_b11980 [Sinorhizobium fredii NGR234]